MTKTVVQVPGESNKYLVASSSGRGTYEVTYRGSGDADPEYVALWHCTCPAYKYRRDVCKHIEMVINYSAEVNEYDDDQK